MLLDSQLAFVPIGANLSLIGGAGLSVPSTNVIDLLGQGVGTAPQNIIGNVTTFGTDLGIGVIRPLLEAVVGTAFATASGATLNCAVQGAQDTGSAGGYLPGAYQTFMETGPITAAQLTAATVFARFDWPPAFPANFQPRYMRLLFTIATGSFTAGTVASAIVTMDRDDQANKFAAANYRV